MIIFKKYTYVIFVSIFDYVCDCNCQAYIAYIDAYVI